MKSIDHFLQGEIRAGQTPGLQYFLFDCERIIHRFSGGLASVQKERPVDELTSFHGYSVTKTFTALALLQLAHQGRLDIDHPAIRCYPEFPYGQEITVRQVMNHTAGIPNPIPLRWIHLAADHTRFDQKVFFDKVLAENAKLRSKPGVKFAYSNLGYILLGRIIEHVTGGSFESYIQEHILDRLPGGSGPIGFTIQDPALHATGYHRTSSFSYLILGMLMDKSAFMGENEGRWRPFHPFYVNGAAYGGLVGTPTAFVRYIQSLLAPGDGLLPEPYRKWLFTEQHTANGKATGMCLSWFKGSLGDRPYRCHAGGGGGFYCEIRIYPEHGLGSVIFLNRSGMSDERLLDKVDRLYFQD